MHAVCQPSVFFLIAIYILLVFSAIVLENFPIISRVANICRPHFFKRIYVKQGRIITGKYGSARGPPVNTIVFLLNYQERSIDHVRHYGSHLPLAGYFNLYPANVPVREHQFLSGPRLH